MRCWNLEKWNNKSQKAFLALVLALTMLFILIPWNAFASDSDDAGDAGETVTSGDLPQSEDGADKADPGEPTDPEEPAGPEEPGETESAGESEETGDAEPEDEEKKANLTPQTAPASMAITAAEADAHTVSFVDWNGTVLYTSYVEDGGAATAPADPSRTGYTFSGWSQSFDAVFESLIVRARYQAIQYNINYNLGGGTNASGNPATYTIEDTPMWFYPPARAGFAFVGWTSGFSIPGGSTGNVTLTARWESTAGGFIPAAGYPNVMVGRTTSNGQGLYYIVVYDGNGRIIASETGIRVSNQDHNGAGTFEITGAGYTVTVTLQGNSLDKNNPPVLTSYRISYEPGTKGAFSPVTHSRRIGETTPPVPLNFDVPIEPGWVFTGWSPTWSPRVTGDVTYIAQWALRNDLSYIVNYYLAGTITPLIPGKTITGQTMGASVTENAIAIAGYTAVAPTSETITIAATGNVINFYYTANTDIEYTVNYYLAGTTTPLAPGKPVPGQTMGASVTENAIAIAGYTAVAPTSVTITLAAAGNVITFFYMPNAPATAAYTVSHIGTDGVTLLTQNLTGTVGATATAAPQTFSGYTYAPGHTGNVLSGSITANVRLVLTVMYTLNTVTPATAAYTVSHVGTDGVTLLTQNLTGTVGATATAAPQTFGGYTYAPGHTGNFLSGTIVGNGSLALTVMYAPVTAPAEVVVVPPPAPAAVVPPPAPPAAPAIPPADPPDDPPGDLDIQDDPPPLAPPDPVVLSPDPTDGEEEEDDEALIIIDDPGVPLGQGGTERTWALWNLILSIAGAILAVMMGIRVLLKRKRDKQEDEQGIERNEEEEKARKRMLLVLAVPILAIAAFIIFFLTQDMRLKMILVDWWTIVHAVLFAAGIICYIFAFKRGRDEEDDFERHNITEATTTGSW